MAELLLINKIPYSVIGGTTAYIEMTITVPVTVIDATTGVSTVTNVPIAYGDADITAVAYVGSGGIEKAVVSDSGVGDRSILVKLSSLSTGSLSKATGTVSASLDVSAVLNNSIANTSYKAGDTIGYRWFFFVEANLL